MLGGSGDRVSRKRAAIKRSQAMAIGLRDHDSNNDVLHISNDGASTPGGYLTFSYVSKTDTVAGAE